MSFPTYLDPVERKIINRVIKQALANGWLISVFDGEEYPVKYSREYGKITAEVAATDETRLVIRAADRAKLGTVLFIHGNGEDVLSDYSWVESGEASTKEAMDELCKEGN